MSKNSRGFTLLELLVALALMAILVSALYGTFFSLTAARDRAEAVSERSRELRTTLDKLRRELAAAWYKKAATTTDSTVVPKFRFEVEDRDFFGKPASILTFTTIVPPAAGSQPLSDLMEVEYRPTAVDQSMKLVRRAKDATLAVEPVAYTQMEDLQGFLVECSNDGTKWERTWSGKLRERTLSENRVSGLPAFIRVTLLVKDGDKNVPYVAIISPRMVQ